MATLTLNGTEFPLQAVQKSPRSLVDSGRTVAGTIRTSRTAAKTHVGSWACSGLVPSDDVGALLTILTGTGTISAAGPVTGTVSVRAQNIQRTPLQTLSHYRVSFDLVEA
jgi:hypothetical protein